MKFDKLSIIIPVYNEARTIHQILDELYKLQIINDIKKEIILVDDCSKDASAETIEACRSAPPSKGGPAQC